MLRSLSSVGLCWIVGLAATIAVAAPPAASSATARENKAEKTAPWDSTDQYELREIQGWEALVNRRLLADKALCGDVLKLLDFQLYQITRQVPPPALAKLRTIKIWVERDEPHHPCMAFHPDAGWLREHNMNPEKAGCVEIANGKNFLEWTRQQPWMVLHELAHGYHDLFSKAASAIRGSRRRTRRRSSRSPTKRC